MTDTTPEVSSATGTATAVTPSTEASDGGTPNGSVANGHGPRVKEVRQVDRVVIRFAGDSGDGMQLTGERFTSETAAFGNDLSTLPDFPAEIRAPAGSPAGVSGFQLHFSDHDILTPGDAPQVLVAMNPAALKANLEDVEKGGIIIVNSDEFTAGNLRKASYAANPIDDGTLNGFTVIQVPLTTLNRHSLADLP